MQLLIITQKVDQQDPILGFFHNWLKKFASHLDTVKVICLEKGLADLPINIEIKSLGKEGHNGRLARFFNFWRYLWQWRHDYTHVLVHMNPKYLVIAGWWWRLTGKKTALWYTHKSVDWQLRIAEKFCDKIFTASAQSFRLPSAKMEVLGHGIDTDIFQPTNQPKENLIICVGRISPTKRQLDLIKTLEPLLQERPDIKLALIGQPIYQEDKNYLEEIKKHRVILVGSVANQDMPSWYNRARLLVNLSQTGSLDKDVLEAMACNLTPLTTNWAFDGFLPADHVMTDLNELSKKVQHFLQQSPRYDYRALILQKHNLDNLIATIIKKMQNLSGLAIEDVRSSFNQTVGEKLQGNYEYQRWFSSRLLRAGYQMTLNALKNRLKNVKFSNGLELGPGAGTWTKLLLETNPQAHLDLVDISKEMLNLAKENLKQFNNIDFYEKNFLDFSPNKQYDLFFSVRVIEYFPDKALLVKKIDELIAPGGSGLIVTKTPHRRSIRPLHQNQISPQLLIKLLTKQGFKNIAVYPVITYFPLLHWVWLNKLLFSWFSNLKLNRLSQFFSESYLVRFSK